MFCEAPSARLRGSPKLLLLLSNRAEKYASPMQAKVEVRPVSVSGLTYEVQYMQSCMSHLPPQAAHSGAASDLFQSDGFLFLQPRMSKKGEDLGNDTVHQLHPNDP